MTSTVLNASPFLLTSTKLVALTASEAPQRQYVHRVTLINHKLDRSLKLDVVTFSEAFTDVLREVSYLRNLYKLTGYTLDPESEIEQLTDLF